MREKAIRIVFFWFFGSLCIFNLQPSSFWAFDFPLHSFKILIDTDSILIPNNLFEVLNTILTPFHIFIPSIPSLYHGIFSAILNQIATQEF